MQGRMVQFPALPAVQAVLPRQVKKKKKKKKLPKESQRNSSKPFIRSCGADGFSLLLQMLFPESWQTDRPLSPTRLRPLSPLRSSICNFFFFSGSLLLTGSISSQSQIECWQIEMRRNQCFGDRMGRSGRLQRKPNAALNSLVESSLIPHLRHDRWGTENNEEP